ncbi:hypothetical protein FDG2_4261 [Candidatus Protofrankia californiensis]|uniref:Uncharacterized protein n=1 Tax=Candidatus Protofrankia californiensis TaxID=1839754 RepID=A0A1C3P4K7_9ACTN|nr:hypothetical protein FDG2_4261 [Candidatus Protofrankia californiensis]
MYHQCPWSHSENSINSFPESIVGHPGRPDKVAVKCAVVAYQAYEVRLHLGGTHATHRTRHTRGGRWNLTALTA